MSTSASDLMYALQEVPGKGKGLVAIRKISMGTRILSEEPIVRALEAVLDREALLESTRRQVGALTQRDENVTSQFTMGRLNTDGNTRLLLRR